MAARFVLRPLTTIRPPYILHFRAPSLRHTVNMSTTRAAAMQSEPGAPQATSFNTLTGKVDPALLAALKDMKFETMSPVQEKVMTTLPDMGSDW